jgi:flagellar M-ring protein FliF
MEQIRQALLRLQDQLRGLTSTQKMLVGALAVIVVMTLLYWGRFASDRELAPLLNTALSSEEQARITSALSGAGIQFELQNGRIMVAKDKAMAAWGELSFVGALPENSQASFDEMIKVFDKINLFDSNIVIAEKFRLARQDRLQQAIATWRSVASVRIEINEKDTAGIARRSEPSASVIMATRSTAATPLRKLAEAAADTVSRSVPGLKRENVSVTINEASFIIKPRDTSMAGASGELLEQIVAYEDQFAQKIERRYSHIPGLQVQVKVKLNTEDKSETRDVVDPSQTVQITTDETTKKIESREPQVGGEPGVASNIGLDASTATAQPGGTSEENTQTKYNGDWSKSRVVVRTPAGDASVAGVTVGVPRSYFVAAWKAMNPTTTSEPTAEVVREIADKTLADITEGVQKLMGIPETQISVAEFLDVPAGIALAAAGGSVATGGSTAKDAAGLVGGYGREIGVGLLALVSLFMVSRLVKKSTPPAPLPPPVDEAAEEAKRNKIDRLEGGEALVGEVMEGGPVLVGQELDEEAVEGKQILEQVESLVKDNPDAAALLVKRWLNRS